MTHHSKYFYGNEISQYGQENGYVDYATLSKAFNAVLNNDLMSATADIGYWEIVSGMPDHSEEIDALREKIETLDDLRSRADDETIDALDDEITALEDEISELEDDEPGEVFQWYIVDDNGAEILQEVGEIVYYNEALDIYL